MQYYGNHSVVVSENNMAAKITQREPYIGEKRKALRDGHGVYSYENKFFKYEGQWKNGKKHGHGKLLLADGSYFEGQFIDGEIDGIGFRYFADTKCKYQGQFNKGELHGKGRMTWPDGSVYEGQWCKNRRQGFGVMKSLMDKSMYKGGYYENKKHGQGTMVYPQVGIKRKPQPAPPPPPPRREGDRYDGDWVLDKKHGTGDMQYKDGTVYEGNFENDQFHGDGIMRHCSGLIYEGKWLHGNPTRLPVKIVIIVEKDPTVIVQGEPFEIRVECQDKDGKIVEEDRNRELQIMAGFKDIRPTKGSALFDMIEDVEDKPIETPYGYSVVPYPLTDQVIENTAVEEEEDGKDDSEKDQQDMIEGGEKEEEKEEPGSQDEEMVNREATEVTEDQSQLPSESQPSEENDEQKEDTEKEDTQIEEQTLLSPDKETVPLPPPVPCGRTEGGVCTWSNLQLAQAPPMYRPFVAMDEEEKKKKAKQAKFEPMIGQMKRSVAGFYDESSSETDSYSDSDDDNSECEPPSSFPRPSPVEAKRATRVKKEEHFARTGEYVLMVHDVTNPPFMDHQLEPAFLLLKLKKPKRDKPKKEPKPKWDTQKHIVASMTRQ